MSQDGMDVMGVIAEGVPDGIVVRLAVEGDRWAESIPPLPDGFDVSVSFSCDEAEDLHGAALALLGYRVVPPAAGPDWPGTAAPGGASPRAEAHFLVPRPLARAHRRWYRALLEGAERAYDLAFGPAAALLAGVLATHTRPR